MRRAAGATAPDLPALPVQYADYTLWQHEVLGDESDPESAIARQLAFWTSRCKDLPDQLELPLDRPRPAVSSYRGDSVSAAARRRAARRLCWRWRASSGASLFMVLQAGARGACSRGWVRAPTSRSAARSRAAPTARSTIWSASSSTPWCCAPTCPAIRASASCSARVRASNLAAYSHQDLPFERLVEVLNPARSLSRHPLFQVMLALQNNAPASLRAARADGAIVEPVDTAQRQVRPVARPRRAARRGRRAGGDRRACSNTPPTCSTGRASRRWRVGWFGCWRRRWRSRSGRSAASTFSLPRSATPSCAGGTTPRVRSRPPPCRSCSRRRSTRTPRRHRGGVRGAERSAMASSMRAPTSWRITCASSASAPRPWWGCASSARSR